VVQFHFWRDKQQREVDFVVPRGRERVDAIECKWKPTPSRRGPRGLPGAVSEGRNFVASPLPGPGYKRTMNEFQIEFVTRLNCELLSH